MKTWLLCFLLSVSFNKKDPDYYVYFVVLKEGCTSHRAAYKIRIQQQLEKSRAEYDILYPIFYRMVPDGYYWDDSWSRRVRCNGGTYVWCKQTFKIAIVQASLFKKIDSSAEFTIQMYIDGLYLGSVSLKLSEMRTVNLQPNTTFDLSMDPP